MAVGMPDRHLAPANHTFVGEPTFRSRFNFSVNSFLGCLEKHIHGDKFVAKTSLAVTSIEF